MRMRGGRAPPAALLCLALALLSAAAASWLLASRAAAPPPLPPPTPPTPPVRTIVAYSQRRLHELARRPPLTCDSDIGAPPPVDRVGDAYSAEGWEELLAPGFSDDGWPPEAFGLSAAARPLSGAGGRSTVTEGHVYDTATSAVAENVIERVERTMELGEVLQGTVYDYSGFPIKDGDNQSTADADFEVRQQLPRRDSLDDKGGLADYGGWLPPDVGTAVWPVARQWARVPGGGAWLLSAHGDRRLRDFQYVRLLAVGGRPRQRLFCRLRLTGDSASVLLEAQPTALWPAQWGDGDPASQPYLLSCSLPANLTVDQVASVSVAADHPCAPPSQELHLEPPLVPEDRPGANRRDFAVCLKALHFPGMVADTQLVVARTAGPAGVRTEGRVGAPRVAVGSQRLPGGGRSLLVCGGGGRQEPGAHRRRAGRGAPRRLPARLQTAAATAPRRTRALPRRLPPTGGSGVSITTSAAPATPDTQPLSLAAQTPSRR
ncbi:uncharacterized protein LOC126335186 isoform X3 [Schistocerca gregaria]|uniref:uncharacterized protein LOC126335186 isoform X3 n=1 Tax=Schistocerca gregaria TaxID=7010 RepID=UPI00211E296D|nr:uncharacterized protein LOC126335186 isoform X3 [Schistocerca gregaria]